MNIFVWKMSVTFLTLTIITLSMLDNVTAGRCLVDGEMMPFNDSEICCGKIYPKHHNGKERECCNGAIYFKDEKLCCNETLRSYDRHFSKGDYDCCNIEIIKVSERICCNEKIYPRNQYYCDGHIALENNEIACINKYNDTDYAIYSSDLFDDYDCCGKDLIRIDSQTEICEDDKVIPISDVKTCGSTRYNIRKQVCCTGTISDYLIDIPKNINYGDKVFPNLECAGGKIVDKYNNNVIKKGNHIQIIPKGHKQCGDASYVDNLEYPKVRCCNDNINYDIPGSNVNCCGNETINQDMYTCCNGSKLPKKTLCCGGIYSYSREDRDKLCCSGRLVSAASHLCCDDVIVDKTSSYHKCCGRRGYDTLENDCCHKAIVNKTHKCSNDYFDNTKRDTIVDEDIPTVRESDGECSTCPKDLPSDTMCTKRYEYRFFIQDIYRERKAMDVVILSPTALEGLRITIRSKFICPCIKELSSYAMFTNRNYWQKIRKSSFPRLTFSERDILSKLEMKRGRMTPALKCEIDRYYKVHRS